MTLKPSNIASNMLDVLDGRVSKANIDAIARTKIIQAAQLLRESNLEQEAKLVLDFLNSDSDIEVKI